MLGLASGLGANLLSAAKMAIVMQTMIMVLRYEKLESKLPAI